MTINPANISQQTQPYLPGFSDDAPSGPKQPHQMSPEEFAAHPLAVFHAGQQEPRATRGDYADIHAGTEQAALERAAHKGSDKSQKYQINPGPQKMFVYWHHPQHADPQEARTNTTAGFGEHGEYDNPFSDQDANEHSTKDSQNLKKYGEDQVWADNGAQPRSWYYTNDAEDLGSLSVVTTKPGALKSQADYVASAIAKGKEHEIHPKTLAMYKSGALQAGEQLDHHYMIHDLGEAGLKVGLPGITKFGTTDRFLPYFNTHPEAHGGTLADNGVWTSPHHLAIDISHGTPFTPPSGSKGPDIVPHESYSANKKRLKSERISDQGPKVDRLAKFLGHTE